MHAITSRVPERGVCICRVPVSVVELCVGGCVCLPAWDGMWTFTGPTFSVSVCAVAPSMHSATHLPYDKKDESSAQHQGEHVAEGRKGECHGRARQPDDEMGRERERGFLPCSLSLSGDCPPSF